MVHRFLRMDSSSIGVKPSGVVESTSRRIQSSKQPNDAFTPRMVTLPIVEASCECSVGELAGRLPVRAVPPARTVDPL